MKAPFHAKCCGITCVDDARAAAQAGFDAVGLVFAARSKRRLTLARAARLRRELPGDLCVVALCMDNPATEVARIVAEVQPQVLQFHGAEEDSWCRQFGLPWIKAVAMGEGREALAELTAYPHAAALLLDGNRRGRVGGEGVRFDWSLVPARTRQPWILAGGLDADNVGAAVRVTHPWGVDVSSGVEASPGRKDHGRMQAFGAALRACAADFSGTADD